MPSPWLRLGLERREIGRVHSVHNLCNTIMRASTAFFLAFLSRVQLFLPGNVCGRYNGRAAQSVFVSLLSLRPRFVQHKIDSTLSSSDCAMRNSVVTFQRFAAIAAGFEALKVSQCECVAQFDTARKAGRVCYVILAVLTTFRFRPADAALYGLALSGAHCRM